jgi:hypothetical protein
VIWLGEVGQNLGFVRYAESILLLDSRFRGNDGLLSYLGEFSQVQFVGASLLAKMLRQQAGSYNGQSEIKSTCKRTEELKRC